jgi:tRNA threonylcarbamoyladenosine biosynthesis protein TsaE
MEAIGAEVAGKLGSGAIVALVGGLGAGKTRWTKGFARATGFAGEVTSPTFSLVHEYRGGRLPLFHFDLYRLKSADELLSIGWDEYCDQPGILLVEWADLFPELLPPGTLWLQFEILPSGGRRITASGGNFGNP